MSVHCQDRRDGGGGDGGGGDGSDGGAGGVTLRISHVGVVDSSSDGGMLVTGTVVVIVAKMVVVTMTNTCRPAETVIMSFHLEDCCVFTLRTLHLNTF